MDLLGDLRTRLTCTGGNTEAMSCVEAYDGLVKISDRGRDCEFAQKSLLVFFEKDYSEVKKLVGELHSLMYRDAG